VGLGRTDDDLVDVDVRRLGNDVSDSLSDRLRRDRVCPVRLHLGSCCLVADRLRELALDDTRVAAPDTAQDVAQRVLEALVNGPAEQYMNPETERTFSATATIAGQSEG
jgi:hypothetical protein